MGVHDGHRARMKEQFLKTGLEGLADVNALELLLFYAIPRRDVNPIAHALLERFGSLSGVFEAPAEELCRVEGVSENTAALLKLIPQAARRYLQDSNRRVKVLNNTELLGEYLLPYFFAERTEAVYLLCLDAMCKPLSVRLIARGSINSAAVTPRAVVEAALSAGATSVVLAHNHPSGVALPSNEDLQVTGTLFRALDAVSICLLDHLIFSGGDYVSLTEDGVIPRLLEEVNGF